MQKNGQKEEAIRLYEECFQEGLNDPRFNLAYALLIIREGQYAKAKQFLVDHQKAPGMTPDQRTNLLVDYAVCCFRLGDVDKAVTTLEQQFRKMETGLLYQTLGYLYVEQFDLARKPEYLEKIRAAREAEAAKRAGEAEKAAQEQPEGEEAPAPAEAEEPAPLPTPEEEWEAGAEKAEAFLQKAIEYDDEDPICLDNMGQFLYRVRGDQAAAKEWFEKALARKDSQIDTLYFLSRYDLEAGDTAAARKKMETALEGRFSPLNYCTKDMVQEELARLKG